MGRTTLYRTTGFDTSALEARLHALENASTASAVISVPNSARVTESVGELGPGDAVDQMSFNQFAQKVLGVHSGDFETFKNADDDSETGRIYRSDTIATVTHASVVLVPATRALVSLEYVSGIGSFPLEAGAQYTIQSSSDTHHTIRFETNATTLQVRYTFANTA